MVAKRATEVISVTTVGGDVAITPDRPVLIEGSPTHGVRMARLHMVGIS